MKLCMMSLMMPEYTPAEIVQTALECGMAGIDWITTHGHRADELRRICDDAGLPVVAHTLLMERFVRREANPLDPVKQGIDDALTLGAGIMMLPPFPRQPASSMEQDRREWIEFYREAAPLVAEAGIVPTLESTGFANSPVTTADEMLEVLAAVPELRLTFDNGNIATAEDPLAAWRRCRDAVVHVHFKDWHVTDAPAADAERKRNGRYFAMALLGEGDLALDALWRELRAGGYHGYINLETCKAGVPTPLALKQAAAYLRTL